MFSTKSRDLFHLGYRIARVMVGIVYYYYMSRSGRVLAHVPHAPRQRGGVAVPAHAAHVALAALAVVSRVARALRLRARALALAHLTARRHNVRVTQTFNIVILSRNC